MLSVADLFPVLGLRISAGPLELRGITDDDLPAVCELALGGIHGEDEMPFYVPWTMVPRQSLPRNIAQYHWRTRAEFAEEAWTLNLSVWHEGVLVGTQGITTERYLVTRTGETGSWLGRAHQGKGIGTAMRQVMCAFMFDHLDAAEVTSAAFLDNPASLAVSRKVGYRPNGVRRLTRRPPRDGPQEMAPYEMALNQELALAPEDLVRYEHELVVEGLAPVRHAVGFRDPRQ